METITNEDSKYLNELKEKYSESYLAFENSLNVSDTVVWSTGSIFNLRPFEIERSRYGFGKQLKTKPTKSGDYNEYFFYNDTIVKLNRYNTFGLFETMFTLHEGTNELRLFYRLNDRIHGFELNKIISIFNQDSTRSIVLLMEDNDGAITLLKENIVSKRTLLEIHQVTEQINSSGKTELDIKYVVELEEEGKVKQIIGYRKSNDSDIVKEIQVYPKE